MISIAIPTHNVKQKAFFLRRLFESIEKQTYNDYEIVLGDEGSMPDNTNSIIKRCKGDIIKLICMDDYFYDENALQDIADNFKGDWLVSGCIHDKGDGVLFDPHFPVNHPRIELGYNTIGGLSILAFENKEPLEFDKNLSWLIDCDYYKNLTLKYGEPTILNTINVVIGIHGDQTTYKLDDNYKHEELVYIKKKYGID